MTQISLTLTEAHDLAMRCLINNGCNEENAHAAAHRMIQAEGDLCHSHGLFRMPWYCAGVKSGRANGHSKPRIEQIAPAVIRVDGDRGFAPLGQQMGHRPLVDCARKNGIASMAFVNMFHIAAMWPEVEKLADEGLCAFAFTASYPYVAPAGGMKPVYGTNPMGFGWPRKDAPPLVFDQASSSMARGEIQIAARDGHSVPETAGIGPNGETTTDPNVVLEGAQLGFGDYKGAALAMMIELLAGALIGEFLSIESIEDDDGKGGPPKGGELIIAMDPTKFGDPEGFLARGEKLFEAVLAQEGTRLPGARRFENRALTQQTGIQIPQSLHETILVLLE
ncbi:MAG: delta1-piperideine-2-carboxylate reductase [Gammaproteobacteria bacterium]|jgi:delta1-piperideine-2-carboxylate reductase